MLDSTEDDHVQAVALDTANTSPTRISEKRKWILLGFLIIAAIVLQSLVILCKPVSIPQEQLRDEKDDPSTSGKRHRRLMQQEETEEYYERELKSSKAGKKSTKAAASGKKSKKAKSSAQAHLVGKKSTKAAASGKKPPSKASSDACLSLAEDTVDALEEAILRSNGEQINLCSANIVFDREIAIESNAQEQAGKTIYIRLACAGGECIFDGNNAARLFRFGKATFPDRSFIAFDLVFKGFTFQNGFGGQGAGGLESGGAIQMIGHGRARFEDCTFLQNRAPSANGGAILMETLNEPPGGATLELKDCTFLENYAYNGGGISAIDVSISLKRTLFQDNTCVGNYEGGAIFLGSNDFPYPDDVIVKCIGEENIFVGNTDTDIVGPWEGCGLVVA